MAGRRRVPPAVQSLFEKYTPEGVIARRLPRSDALRLMEEEYGLGGSRAEELIDHFDADQNGYMSLWEFHHFVNVIGSRENSQKLAAKFQAAAGGAGGISVLSAQQVRAALEQMTTPTGEPFNDKEKDFFMKTSSADMGEFTFGQFADLLARIRLYKRPQKNPSTS